MTAHSACAGSSFESAPAGLARCTSGRPAQAGFSLVETLVAISILVTAAIGLAGLFAMSAAAAGRAASRTLAIAAARDKIEELHSRPWSSLETSPPAVLDTDVAGYSDVMSGSSGPPLMRRWSVAPSAADPANLLLLQVVVLGPGGRVEARLTTARRREGA